MTDPKCVIEAVKLLYEAVRANGVYGQVATAKLNQCQDILQASDSPAPAEGEHRSKSKGGMIYGITAAELHDRTADDIAAFLRHQGMAERADDFPRMCSHHGLSQAIRTEMHLILCKANPAPPAPGKMTHGEYRKERERLIAECKAACQFCNKFGVAKWDSDYWSQNTNDFGCHNKNCMATNDLIAALDSRYHQSIAQPDNSPQGEGEDRAVERIMKDLPHGMSNEDLSVALREAFAAGPAAERADAAKLDTKSTAYMSGYEAGIAARDREIEGKVEKVLQRFMTTSMSREEFARELLKKESSRG